MIHFYILYTLFESICTKQSTIIYSIDIVPYRNNSVQWKVSFIEVDDTF